MPTSVPPTASRPVLRSNHSYSVSSNHEPGFMPPADSDNLPVSQGMASSTKVSTLRRNKSLTLSLGPTAFLHRSMPPGPIPVRLQNSSYLQSSSSPFYQRAMYPRPASVQSPPARIPVSQSSGGPGSYFSMSVGSTSHPPPRRSRSSSFSSVSSGSSGSSLDGLNPSFASSSSSLATSASSSEAEDQDSMIASAESVLCESELELALESCAKDSEEEGNAASGIKKKAGRPLSLNSYSSRLSSVPASPPDEHENLTVG